MNQFERKSFTFFESFYVAAKSLSEKQRAKYFEAIFQYAFYGNRIELTGTVKALFDLSEPVINKGISQYKNGKSGGRPEKPTESQLPKNKKPTESQLEIGFSEKESQTEPTSLEGVGVGNKEMDNDMECVIGEDGSTHNTSARPNPNDVLLEADRLGSSMTVEDVARFMAYNDANNWKLEWKYALKRWIEQENQRPKGKPKYKTAPSEEHSYDMDALRRRAKE